jgi:signal recognition particle subunit SEC65
LGNELRHVEDWWGRRVNIDFRFFQAEELETILKAAGYAIDELVEREPYPGVETQTRRAYVLATKSLAGGAG